jgi:hypothetical protein
MKSTCRRVLSLLAGVATSVALLPTGQASAEPPQDAGTVGTAVYVVIRQSFTETTDADQCVGAATLATVRRGSSVVLSEGTPAAADSRKVAVGVFHRSRLKDGTCQVLYITSAPVLPAFNVQFADPAGDVSPTFGPVAAEPVTDQPGIQQAVSVDLQFDAGR